MRNIAYAAVLAALILLAACSRASDPAVDEAVQLKVLYTTNADFRHDFENMIQAKFPNVDIQVIEFRQVFTPGKDMAKSFIDYTKEQQPDLVEIPNHVPGLFSEMAEQGLLAPLDNRIRDDSFDIAGLLPGPVEQIRAAGGGNLFALPLTFTGEALFYNKDLFDRYKIPYPSDQLSFLEMLQLAQRFAGYKDTYGYSKVFQDTGPLVLYAGDSENLKWIDTAGDKIVFDTDGWRGVLKNIADILAAGAVYNTAAHADSSQRQNSLALVPSLKDNPQ